VTRQAIVPWKATAFTLQIIRIRRHLIFTVTTNYIPSLGYTSRCWSILLLYERYPSLVPCLPTPRQKDNFLYHTNIRIHGFTLVWLQLTQRAVKGSFPSVKTSTLSAQPSCVALPVAATSIGANISLSARSPREQKEHN
jgi:hypothetical protein